MGSRAQKQQKKTQYIWLTEQNKKTNKASDSEKEKSNRFFMIVIDSFEDASLSKLSSFL